MKIPKENGKEIAEHWARWCGWQTCKGRPNRWTHGIKRFGELGGLVQWYCGYPQSASAIPLTFALYGPDGTEFPSRSRLKDIQSAIRILEGH